MVKAYFSRLVPFYLLRERDDSEGFDAYPVEVEGHILDLAEDLRSVANEMTRLFDNMPAPEERTQEEADFLSALLTEATSIQGYRTEIKKLRKQVDNLKQRTKRAEAAAKEAASGDE